MILVVTIRQEFFYAPSFAERKIQDSDEAPTMSPTSDADETDQLRTKLNKKYAVTLPSP